MIRAALYARYSSDQQSSASTADQQRLCRERAEREGWAIVDSYGCVGHHRSRICSNSRTIRREELERRALAGIADRLVSANKIDAAVAAYANHINRGNREHRIQADADTRALAKIDKAVAGIMAAIEDGLYQPSMKARISELEREKAEITARLAGMTCYKIRSVAFRSNAVFRIFRAEAQRAQRGKLFTSAISAPLRESYSKPPTLPWQQSAESSRRQPCGLIRYFSPVRFAL